ncbi:ABC transporter permease/M1 family aminopeptidase [Marinifilum sp. RC60d5]|uniref:ABC transporter permease/M1 family aminopeptidase n=1 Tax=Marinifilum sp. RC60d5 TaxID=3458414 RepID=UPI004035A9F0
MSKFYTLFKFEIKYWFKNPATYIYSAVLLIIATLIMAGSLGVFDSNTATMASVRLANSPIALLNSFGILTLGYFLLPSIVGGSINRDFSSEMHSILYSYPFRKSEYILAKFVSSIVITMAIFMVFGLGFIIAPFLPGVNPELLGPFRPLAFLQIYGFVVLPNILLFGAIVFGVITFTRNLGAGFITMIILFIVQGMSQRLMSDLDSKTLAALLDPFGASAMKNATEYWNVAERNANLLPMGGLVLINRLIWLSVSALLFAATYYKFQFSQHALSFRWFSKKGAVVTKDNFNNLRDINLPKVTIDNSYSSNLKLMWSMSIMNFKYIIKSVPFMVVVAFGILFMVFAKTTVMNIMGTATYPTTWKMLMVPGSMFQLFLLLITFLYSGMLVQRERRAKMFELVDVTCTPNWVQYFSKLIALVKVQILLLGVVMFTCICLQIIDGYYVIEPLHYILQLFVFLLPVYIVWAALSMFVQSLVSNFYVGFFILFIFFIASPFISKIGIEQQLFNFNSGPGTFYSDMNGYGRAIPAYLFYRLYWLFFASVLLTLGLAVWRRGVRETIKIRFHRAKENLTRTLYTSLTSSILCFVLIGGYIYWFDNVKHEHKTSKQSELDKVEWEKKYSKYYNIAQPRITDVKVDVDLYPKTHDLNVDGRYIVKNKTNEAIDSIHVNYSYKKTTVDFSRTADLVSEDTVFQYNIYQLEKPLLPGDSMEMHFSFRNEKNHFLRYNSPVLANGTFFNNGSFPSFGYSHSGELSDNTVRKKYNLPKRDRMAPPTDTLALGNTYISECADWVNFETTVSTSADQIAIAPGYLQKKWIEGDRAYFHYKMDKPILNFYAWVSGKYEVFRDKYKGVNIEIYYNKGHEYNLADMDDALKASLKYYGENYSPYPHKQIRIIEFPRTIGTFAQSFPNTIPFSEAIGFIAKEDKSAEGAASYAYQVTAHEMAHQWWAHQVIGANVQGATLMSESLAEYSSIKVMETKYSKAKIRKYMKEELNSYLRGRGGESVKEQPLMYNENQQYIHYNKGAVAMYAISDYMGLDNLNKALSEYISKVAYQEPPYTTSLEFVDLMHRYMPDSLDYVITDMLETITLFDNKVDSAYVSKTEDGKYKVDFIVEAEKYRVIHTAKDSTTNLETDDGALSISFNTNSKKEDKEYVDMNDWIDLAIFVEDENKVEQEILFKKIHITAKENKFSFVVDKKPSSVGIDPYHKLIDRKTSDNTEKVKEKVAVADTKKTV